MISRGVWHQFGHNSQTLALEVLQAGVGVGAIISPRDLKLAQAEDRSTQYRALNAQVLLDYQFYVSEYANGKIETYALDDFRNSVNTLNQVSQTELDSLSAAIEDQNRRLGSAAVIAPAVLYEANRPERLELNRKLFEAAKRAGDVLGVPTLATVGLAHSTVVSPHSISDALAHATSLPCNGWYFIFEFDESRIPYDRTEVLECGRACLTLAANLKPVIHAYAGPMALLSFGFGAAGAGVGHSQTLWQFDRTRWSTAPTEQQGFPAKISPRFFSIPLWGTIIYADEVLRIPLRVRNRLMTHTPFSSLIADPATHGVVEWTRSLADRHLVHSVGTKATELASFPTARAAAQAAIAHLDQANVLFGDIARYAAGVLKTESQNVHQQNWRDVLQHLLDNQGDDFDYLELMAS